MDEKIKSFLDEIEKLCKKYELSISHEDGGGSFIIEGYDDYNIEWLRSARVETDGHDGYIRNGNIEWHR